ncbi:MAG: hypothetical protein IKQ22_06290 [Clostridia bacterium]|nr:hypothetical protein [Clostridia bacterium]
MKKVLLWLWQLPQNILGLLVILVTNAKYNDISYDEVDNFWWAKKGKRFGVSLGNYIIFGPGPVAHDSFKHEQGHQRQSLYLGPLYLLLIGLPSITGNIYDTIAHRNWSYLAREEWYYKQPWEAWADKLGGVER